MQVLSDAGPAGLSLAEIAYRMQKQGLRDLKTTKTPEASIAGAMSRDAVFVRVAPSTFALQSVVTHQRKLLASKQHDHKATPQPKEMTPAAAVPEPGAAATLPLDADAGAAAGAAATPAAKEAQPEEEGEYNSEEEEEEEDGEGGSGRHARAEPWLQALLFQDYDTLSLTDRLGALSFLVNLVCNGPTVRAKLDERCEQGARLKRMLLEEVKVGRAIGGGK